jgi:hypothetical protein
MFNDGRYLERLQSGEFTELPRRDKHPAPAKANQPFCTRSQMISYLDLAGYRVANVHRYLRPDGTLGGSGLPDPKALQVNDVLYYVPVEEGE